MNIIRGLIVSTVVVAVVAGLAYLGYRVDEKYQAMLPDEDSEEETVEPIHPVLSDDEQRLKYFFNRVCDFIPNYGIEVAFNKEWVTPEGTLDYAIDSKPVLKNGTFAWCRTPIGRRVLLVGSDTMNVVFYDSEDRTKIEHCCPNDQLTSECDIKLCSAILELVVDMIEDSELVRESNAA